MEIEKHLSTFAVGMTANVAPEEDSECKYLCTLKSVALRLYPSWFDQGRCNLILPGSTSSGLDFTDLSRHHGPRATRSPPPALCPSQSTPPSGLDLVQLAKSLLVWITIINKSGPRRLAINDE